MSNPTLQVRFIRILRWLLMVPAAIIGWYIGIIIALLVHMVSERLCPTEHIVSGTCHAPWSSLVSSVSLALGSMVCGTLAVLLPTLTAPSHRTKVALCAYVAGLACSVYWLAHSLWVPVAWAALAGAITLWRIK